MPLTFDEARAAFPVLEHFAYLNAGTNGPLARATVEAIVAEQLIDLTQGRGGEPYFSRVLAMSSTMRRRIMSLLN